MEKNTVLSVTLLWAIPPKVTSPGCSFCTWVLAVCFPLGLLWCEPFVVNLGSPPCIMLWHMNMLKSAILCNCGVHMSAKVKLTVPSFLTISDQSTTNGSKHVTCARN